MDGMGCTKQRRRAGEGEQHKTDTRLHWIIFCEFLVCGSALSVGLIGWAIHRPEIFSQHDSVHLSGPNVVL